MYSFAFCHFYRTTLKKKKKKKNVTEKNATTRIWTRDLSITIPASYHWTDAQVVESLMKYM